METKKLTQLVKFITCSLTLVMVSLILIIVYQYVRIASLKNKIGSVQTEIEQLTSEQISLTEQKRFASTSAYIEDVARSKLQKADEGEIGFYFEEE